MKKNYFQLVHFHNFWIFWFFIIFFHFKTLFLKYFIKLNFNIFERNSHKTLLLLLFNFFRQYIFFLISLKTHLNTTNDTNDLKMDLKSFFKRELLYVHSCLSSTSHYCESVRKKQFFMLNRSTPLRKKISWNEKKRSNCNCMKSAATAASRENDHPHCRKRRRRRQKKREWDSKKNINRDNKKKSRDCQTNFFITTVAADAADAHKFFFSFLLLLLRNINCVKNLCMHIHVRI